jgi:hypothetical protein
MFIILSKYVVFKCRPVKNSLLGYLAIYDLSLLGYVRIQFLICRSTLASLVVVKLSHS